MMYFIINYRATLVLLMYFFVNLNRRETGAGLPDPSGPELSDCEVERLASGLCAMPANSASSVDESEFSTTFTARSTSGGWAEWPVARELRLNDTPDGDSRTISTAWTISDSMSCFFWSTFLCFFLRSFRRNLDISLLIFLSIARLDATPCFLIECRRCFWGPF